MNIIRLHIVAEGQTEETFVNKTLKGYLAEHGVMADVHRITTKRDKRHSKNYRGGHPDYAHLRKDLDLWTRQERNNPDAWFTTMVDLYRFPRHGDSIYTEEIQDVSDPYRKVQRLEAAMADDVADICPRFVPYVQLHEFEALTLCNVDGLGVFFDEERAIERLKTLVEEFESPEYIDEGENTAPSKRIIAEIPAYDDTKATVGAEVAAASGVDCLRRRCPHFGEWISKLITLSGSEAAALDE